MTPAQLLARVRTKKPPAPAAETPIAVDDESCPNLAALNAEFEAAMTAAENGDPWNGRDPAVIEDEMHAAERAARVAADLNMGATGNITRKEFEEFKVTVAIAFIGLSLI